MEQYTAGYLSNGVGYLLAPRTSAHVTHVDVFLRAGPRYESKALNGVTHFLEHLLVNPAYFRGKVKRLWSALEARGATLGAWTSKEFLMLRVVVPAEVTETALDFARVMLEPVRIRKADVEVERPVILDELMRRRYSAQQAFLIVEEALFGGGYGQPVLGKETTVREMTYREIKTWAERATAADSVRVVVSGNVEEATMAGIEQFGDLERGEPLYDEGYVEVAPRFVAIPGNSPRVRLLLAFPGPGMNREDRYASEVLAYLSGAGLRSRIFQDLRQKSGLAYEVFGGSLHYEHAGILFFNVELARERLFDGFRALIDSVRSIAGLRLSSEDTKRAVEGLVMNLLQQTEAAQVSRKLGMNWLLDVLFFPSREAMRYRRVTPADVRGIADKYLKTETMAMAVVGVGAKELTKMMEAIQ
ncbi:MAG TPA: insulinase family protein [Oceanithermus profundus]|uniref:Insulinase family protein n=1 Tax=Oceanithermus profundus TaxID=187137 RepID=A0A7C4ZHV3_9DEIN|nr:insulinase family protein [Oceanithermus profundus]